uniref:Uncharacterized protein n=1 Tax=Capra hircus TaxID=9925 RepID=A0A8C2P5I4_CAPHI
MHRPRRPASPRFQPSGSVQVPAAAAAAAGLDGRRLPRPPEERTPHLRCLERDDSVTVPRKVDAAVLPFQTIFFITAFCSTCIIRDGLSGIIFFKGSLLYTSYNVLQSRKVKL